MESIAIVLSLAVPLVFALLARRAHEQTPEEEDSGSVAQQAAVQLGLEQRGDRYGGLLEDGHDLELWAESEGRNQLGERVTARVTLREPVATELNVVPTSGDKPSDVSVGYDFDLRYRVTSAHPERAARLLFGKLSGELISADLSGYTVELASEHVSVTARWVTSMGSAVRAAECAEELARRLIAAEAAQPELVPWRDVARAWAVAAERVGAQFSRDARVLLRRVPFGELQAHPSSECEERWFATLRLSFERPLPVRFTLADEGARSLFQRWSRRDLEIGDPELDAAFHLVSEEPDGLSALLDRDVRSALLELERESGTILVNERMVEARIEAASVTDAERLTAAFEAVLSAGEALDRAARPKGHGAYR